MTAVQYKILENRLRHAAARQGLRLAKSRRRDPRALGYGSYMLVDDATNAVVVWGLDSGYGLDLADVAHAMWGEDGTGCRVHLDADELPGGRLIAGAVSSRCGGDRRRRARHPRLHPRRHPMRVRVLHPHQNDDHRHRAVPGDRLDELMPEPLDDILERQRQQREQVAEQLRGIAE
jgi:hypothetical protein